MITFAEATYIAQRKLYYGQQQPQTQMLPQRVQASPQQQAFYNQQQFNLLQQQQQPTVHSGHVMSHAGYVQAHPQRQQQPHSYANVNMGPEVIDGQFVSRDRMPTVDAAMMGVRRGQKVTGIGGNPELAAQIASLATRRNSQKEMTPPTQGGEEFVPFQRTQRSYTVSGPHSVSGHYPGVLYCMAACAVQCTVCKLQPFGCSTLCTALHGRVCMLHRVVLLLSLCHECYTGHSTFQ